MIVARQPDKDLTNCDRSDRQRLRTSTRKLNSLFQYLYSFSQSVRTKWQMYSRDIYLFASSYVRNYCGIFFRDRLVRTTSVVRERKRENARWKREGTSSRRFAFHFPLQCSVAAVSRCRVTVVYGSAVGIIVAPVSPPPISQDGS